LTQAIMWLDRKTEESVKVDLYDYPHLIDFNDRIVFEGNTYYLRSNTFTMNERIINRQSLEFVRWY
jgi:folylpolyglutamate synthase/dihydropteroate synthase